MDSNVDLNDFKKDGKKKDIRETTAAVTSDKQLEAFKGDAPKTFTTFRRYVQWAETSEDVYTATGTVKKILPSALYKVKKDDMGHIYFEKQPIKTDEFIRFSNSMADDILKEIEDFWTLKNSFTKYKFLHRRGYLIYGSQGGGKSIIVRQIIDGIIKNHGVAIWADSHPKLLIEGIQILRRVEPERPVVTVFEDIDAIIDEWGEPRILSYLDGEDQTDNVLNLATTNYPERLDKRIVSRPRRFDRVIKVDMPNDSIRKEYFKHKVKGLNDTDLSYWTDATAGFSFAALADLIISVKCFQYDFETAVNNLRRLLRANPSSNEFKQTSTGF